MAYSVDLLRASREQKEAPTGLAAIPASAPIETDETIGYWNGRAFVSWREWILSRPIQIIPEAEREKDPPAEPQAHIRRRPRKR